VSIPIVQPPTSWDMSGEWIPLYCVFETTSISWGTMSAAADSSSPMKESEWASGVSNSGSKTNKKRLVGHYQDQALTHLPLPGRISIPIWTSNCSSWPKAAVWKTGAIVAIEPSTRRDPGHGLPSHL